jgi:hypothetical protein
MSQSATKRVRYNFGTTGGEILGERTCKRLSAKHLEFLPSLLEGRRSIRLSYGRTKSNLFYFLSAGKSIAVAVAAK